MVRVKQLSSDQKAQILVYLEQNISNSEIARKIGCSEGSIRYLKKKMEQTGSTQRKKGSGRKKKLSVRQQRLLKRLSLQNRFATAPQLRADLEQECSVDVSIRTVQRVLNDMGLMARRPAKKPLLTSAMKKKRLAWAKEHKNWTLDEWKNVVFSDESKFNFYGSDAQSPVRRRRGEKYKQECIVPTVKHSPSVMVWGCITSRGVGQILFVKDSVNAEKYKTIINEGLVPSLEDLSAHTSDFIFQDDSAPCHRARSITNHKENLGIMSLPWPGNSPDLNPIENVWNIMARKMQTKKPTNVENLKICLERVWYDEINQEIIDNLYKSMPQRILAVIKAKGGPTKY